MGDWKINGIEFVLEPTVFRWVDPEPVGVTGDGHPIYPAVFNFEMRWDITYPSGTSQLIDFFKSTSLTGTIFIDLPQYDGPTYVFQTYSGCTLSRPTRGDYFAEHPTQVAITVQNIRV